MDGRFDPTKYETVKQRKDRIAVDHPDHVILAVPIGVSKDEATFTVGVWRKFEDAEKGADRLAAAMQGGAAPSPLVALLLMCPDSLGTAYEANWMSGASKTSWTENCEESAIGRALDNLGYHGGGKCSREEILKAKEAETVLASMPKAAAEHPFGAGTIPSLDSMPTIKAKIGEMKGKPGVKEFRALAMHALIEGWKEEKLSAFARGLGIDLFNGAKAEDYQRVLEEIKRVRGVGCTGGPIGPIAITNNRTPPLTACIGGSGEVI